MEHNVRIITGKVINEKSWDIFYDNLSRSEKAIGSEIVSARQAKDYDVNIHQTASLKEAIGDFKKPIEGIMAVEQPTKDLIICKPHLDITKDVELATGGKLMRTFIRYWERDSRVVTPKSFHKFYYLRLYIGKPQNEVLALIPSGTPDTTDYALENIIMSNFPKGIKINNTNLPINPQGFLDEVGKMKRLEKIKSARVQVYRKGSNAPTEIQQIFEFDAVSYRNFTNWFKDLQNSYNKVELVSIRFSLTLGDIDGNTFDVVLKPLDKSPIGVEVSQKSSSKKEAYILVTDVLHKILNKKTQ